MQSRLWRWNGEPESRAEQLKFPGMKELKNIEGMSFFSYKDKDMVLFVCDDGSSRTEKGAHYCIVSVDTIVTMH